MNAIFKRVLLALVSVLVFAGLFAVAGGLSDPDHFSFSVRAPYVAETTPINSDGFLLIITKKSRSPHDHIELESPKYRDAFRRFVVEGEEKALVKLLKRNNRIHSIYYQKGIPGEPKVRTLTRLDENGSPLPPESTVGLGGGELRISRTADGFIYLMRMRNPEQHYALLMGELPPHTSDARRTVKERVSLYTVDGEVNDEAGYAEFALNAVSYVNRHHATKPIHK